MHYVDFVEKVRRAANIETTHDSQLAVEATLATFGERLTRTEKVELGAQLPKELKAFLIEMGDVERFSLEEFYNRVAARADLGRPDAVKRSRAVMMVLQEAVTEGLLKPIRQRLPAEYNELFGSEPLSPLSPTR
jgi:uncharacterized protein (DUF2267 family)